MACDISRLHCIAGIVAPSIALIGNDCCELLWAELFAKCPHSRARFAVHHNIEMIGDGPSGDSTASEGGEGRWYASSR